MENERESEVRYCCSTGSIFRDGAPDFLPSTRSRDLSIPDYPLDVNSRSLHPFGPSSLHNWINFGRRTRSPRFYALIARNALHFNDQRQKRPLESMRWQNSMHRRPRPRNLRPLVHVWRPREPVIQHKLMSDAADEDENLRTLRFFEAVISRYSMMVHVRYHHGSLERNSMVMAIIRQITFLSNRCKGNNKDKETNVFIVVW